MCVYPASLFQLVNIILHGLKTKDLSLTHTASVVWKLF